MITRERRMPLIHAQRISKEMRPFVIAALLLLCGLAWLIVWAVTP